MSDVNILIVQDEEGKVIEVRSSEKISSVEVMTDTDPTDIRLQEDYLEHFYPYVPFVQ